MSFDLNTIWFMLVGILFTGYAVLDGFDLGVGALHLLGKTDSERRTLLNAIGPVWDGNEVWLVTGGGALFAAFPEVYASVFSGFYLAFMLLLFALIFRAVAIEFRSKRESRRWRQIWDVSFAISSIASALLIGVTLGNIAWGLPLTATREITIGFWNLFRPYPLLVGITTVALFLMHGAIYLVLKTENELHDKIRGWVRNTIIFFIMCYVLTTIATLLYVPHMVVHIRGNPLLLVIPVLNIFAIANIPREIDHGSDIRAFLSSCASVILMLALFGIGMYPNLVYSSPNLDYSLSIYNSASSPGTLRNMLYIALMGMPLVLSYTISVYWIFRGKVKLESHSY
jgi:cytochrome d ubiquinol oxidase subunit II